jgi:hypothetical protein
MNSTTFFCGGHRFEVGQIGQIPVMFIRFNGRRMHLEVSFCECPDSGGHEKTGITMEAKHHEKRGAWAFF